jgi:hypothetical protein
MSDENDCGCHFVLTVCVAHLLLVVTFGLEREIAVELEAVKG